MVIVTGASSGIGLATAREFARRGATVLAVARREERLRELVEACRADSPASDYLAGDLGERGFAERVVDRTVVARHGRLDVLVNNHAISKHKHALHTSAEEAEQVLRVNFLSCVWTTYAALPVAAAPAGRRRDRQRLLLRRAGRAAARRPLRRLEGGARRLQRRALERPRRQRRARRARDPGAIDTEIWEKEDEPPGFSGKKHPPELVVRAILEVIERARYEIDGARARPGLVTAKLLRWIAPRACCAAAWRAWSRCRRRSSTAARERARKGLRLGESG